MINLKLSHEKNRRNFSIIFKHFFSLQLDALSKPSFFPNQILLWQKAHPLDGHLCFACFIANFLDTLVFIFIGVTLPFVKLVHPGKPQILKSQALIASL